MILHTNAFYRDETSLALSLGGTSYTYHYVQATAHQTITISQNS